MNLAAQQRGLPNENTLLKYGWWCGGFVLETLVCCSSFDFTSDNHLCLSSNPLPGRIGETNAHSFQGNKRKSQTGKVVMNNTALA